MSPEFAMGLCWTLLFRSLCFVGTQALLISWGVLLRFSLFGKKSSPQDALLSHSDGSHSQKPRSNLGNMLKDTNLVSQWAHLTCSTHCVHSGFLPRMQICLEIDSCLCEWVHRWIWSPSLYVCLVSCVFILPVFPGVPSCIRTCILSSWHQLLFVIRVLGNTLVCTLDIR